MTVEDRHPGLRPEHLALRGSLVEHDPKIGDDVALGSAFGTADQRITQIPDLWESAESP